MTHCDVTQRGWFSFVPIRYLYVSLSELVELGAWDLDLGQQLLSRRTIAPKCFLGHFILTLHLFDRGVAESLPRR